MKKIERSQRPDRSVLLLFFFSRRYARAPGGGWLACFRWGGICWCAWWDPASCRTWPGRTCRETPERRRAGDAGVAPDSPGWEASLRRPDTWDSPRGLDWADPGSGCPLSAPCLGSLRCEKPLRWSFDFGALGVPGRASSSTPGAWISSRSAGSHRARLPSRILTDPGSGSLCRWPGTLLSGLRGKLWRRRGGGIVWARSGRAVCASAGGRLGLPDSWTPSRTRDTCTPPALSGSTCAVPKRTGPSTLLCKAGRWTLPGACWSCPGPLGASGPRAPLWFSGPAPGKSLPRPRSWACVWLWVSWRFCRFYARLRQRKVS